MDLERAPGVVHHCAPLLSRLHSNSHTSIPSLPYKYPRVSRKSICGPSAASARAGQCIPHAAERVYRSARASTSGGPLQPQLAFDRGGCIEMFMDASVFNVEECHGGRRDKKTNVGIQTKGASKHTSALARTTALRRAIVSRSTSHTRRFLDV